MFQSFGFITLGPKIEYEKEQTVTMTPQVDISDSPARKRPFPLEHPAPLKQLKQSEEDDSLHKAPITDSSSAHTQMDTSVQRPTPLIMLHSAFKGFLQMSVNTEFLNVTDQLQNILQSYDTEAMLEKCENIMASNTNNIPLFSSNQLQIFKDCKQAPELLQKLSPFCNWSNHTVLHEMIRACNNSEASDLLEQFNSQIDLTLPVTDYPIPQPSPNMIPYDTSSHTVLAVKLSAELKNISLQQVFDLQCLLQETFQLSPHSFQLLAANSMPILYWMIPKTVVFVIASNITDQQSFLHQNGIMEVSIYPGLIYATVNKVRVGPLSFLNNYVDFEVINMYTLLYTMNYIKSL